MVAPSVAFAGPSAERKRKAVSRGDVTAPPTKSRKERASNWSVLEILDMVAAKRQAFLQDIEVEDARELMNPEQTRWGKVATQVNEAGRARGGHSPRDAVACKYKWQTLMADYKKVADFHKGTGLVGNEYFELRSKERKDRRLQGQFYEEVYIQMHDWLQYKPSMQPPHSRDLLNPGDGNYSFQEDIFENGMDSEEAVPHTYETQGRHERTSNMSEASNIGWGDGAWTAPQNLHRPPSPSPPLPSCQRQEVDINADAPAYSSPYVP
jgi:hypothetical protein